MNRAIVRWIIEIQGVVQGIGLRPTIQRLAEQAALGGSVQNHSGVVRLVLEGPDNDVEKFMTDLPDRLPAPARLDRVTKLAEEKIPGATAFRILESASGGKSLEAIPPDLAACPKCLQEVMNPHDRRYGYAFTTCTLCGPRYTVVEALPYDRERTTLQAFDLCTACRKEYLDPKDRRFHAESIACPRCGPRLLLYDPLAGIVTQDPLMCARAALRRGRIVAIRGLGGFQLAVRASDRQAVARLRQRKNRPHKPLALMARDIDVIRRYVVVTKEIHDLLSGSSGPIVLCDRKPHAPRLALEINPESDTIGFMLPTTPLHHLLFHPLSHDPIEPFDLLVMTSGNLSAEPICKNTHEAHQRLGSIADLILSHDREINFCIDDSVCNQTLDQPAQVWRRARGYTPAPIVIANPLNHPVLAMGCDLKNTLAVGAGDQIMLSPHLGEISSPFSLDHYTESVDRLMSFCGIFPRVVATDCHPDMHTTRAGIDWSMRLGCKHLTVQHHQAHAAACLAENRCDRALALVFDGAGYGIDGTYWGAELFFIQGPAANRLARFKPAPLPGGDIAVYEPIRQLIARLWQASIPISDSLASAWSLEPDVISTWIRQCESGFNAPISSSAGRLFDAVSSLLELAPRRLTYEGQAAVRLEACARSHPDKGRLEIFPYSASVGSGDLMEIDWSALFTCLMERRPFSDPSEIACSFHHTLVQAAIDMARYGRMRSGSTTIALSGGVFMNRLIVLELVLRLEQEGFNVLQHHNIPPNDGSIALGQAVIAGRSD